MIHTENLIEAFEDTQRQIKENPLLSEATRSMQKGTELFPCGFRAAGAAEKSTRPDIAVVEDTSFHCASVFVNGQDKVAVLNFANACYPGGGVVNGAMAQEECLCRSSNLYAALTLPFLLENYYVWNKRNTGDMGTDALIYSPGVTVFKSDDAIPQDLQDWFQVDVITCAAPYNGRRTTSEDDLRRVFSERIRNILEAASEKNVDILVLGAFGCGAFRNPPRLVAEAFREKLVTEHYGLHFKKTVFAIKRNMYNRENYMTFRETFCGE